MQDNDMLVIYTKVDEREQSGFRGSNSVGNVARVIAETVPMTDLHRQLNVFLEQMNSLLESASVSSTSGFKLDEIEVQANVVMSGEGKVRFALIGSVEVGAEVNGGLLLRFKR